VAGFYQVHCQVATAGCMFGDSRRAGGVNPQSPGPEPVGHFLVSLNPASPQLVERCQKRRVVRPTPIAQYVHFAPVTLGRDFYARQELQTGQGQQACRMKAGQRIVIGNGNCPEAGAEGKLDDLSGRVRPVAAMGVHVQVGAACMRLQAKFAAKASEWLSLGHESANGLGVLAKPIKHAVNECRRIGGSVASRQPDSLVDGHARRHIRSMQQLIGAHSQYIPVNAGHAWQPPVLRGHRQPLVDFGLVSKDAIEHADGKTSQCLCVQSIVNKLFKGRPLDRGIVIALKQ
jgi:hypothetical protein